jgi:HK97 family phage portal protein
MPNLIKKLFKTKSADTSITSLFSGFEHSGDVHSLNSYKDSLYLYIGVSMIMKRVAGIPLELYKIKNKKGDVAEVFDHPLLQLFANPNDTESQRQFWELSVAYYLLSGDCFWYLDRNGASISQMASLRPDLMQILLSTDGKRVIGYEYRASTIVRFKAEDILHIKNIDPTNPLRGTGVVRPASSRILTEIEATKYQANFFENQGRPDMAVFADQVVTDEAGNEFRAKWKSIFGRGKGGQVAVFGSNIKQVQELNKTPKEMDFIETQKFLRDDILAALRIPKAMVSTDDVNLANGKEANRIFLANAVMPVLDAFLDIINHKLIPQSDTTLFFTYTDPTPMDREAMLKETTELKKNGIITANEARAIYNYESVDGADELSASSNAPATDPFAQTRTIELQRKAKNIMRNRPMLVKKLEAIEGIVALTQLTAPKREMNSIFPTKELKNTYAKAFNAKVDRKAEILKEAVDTYHDALLKRILSTELTVGGFMDLQAEKRLAKDAFTPVVVKLYKEAGQDALDAVFKKSADQFFADNVMIAAIEGRVRFFSESISDTTFEVLKTKIVAGIAAGDGIDKIGQSLREYFTDMSVGRAKTIARTETGYALSKATNDAYNQSSVITGKEWINAGDDHVREEHVENGGMIVATNGVFPNGESYPGEQSVNCRCVLAAAV